MVAYLLGSEQMVIEDVTPLSKRCTLTKEDAIGRTRHQMKGCLGGNRESRYKRAAIREGSCVPTSRRIEERCTGIDSKLEARSSPAARTSHGRPPARLRKVDSGLMHADVHTLVPCASGRARFWQIASDAKRRQQHSTLPSNAAHLVAIYSCRNSADLLKNLCLRHCAEGVRQVLRD